jgi:hypothetical protein
MLRSGADRIPDAQHPLAEPDIEPIVARSEQTKTRVTIPAEETTSLSSLADAVSTESSVLIEHYLKNLPLREASIHSPSVARIPAHPLSYVRMALLPPRYGQLLNPQREGA